MSIVEHLDGTHPAACRCPDCPQRTDAEQAEFIATMKREDRHHAAIWTKKVEAVLAAHPEAQRRLWSGGYHYFTPDGRFLI